MEDILGWINRRLLRGTLTVERSPLIRTFVFDGGYIISASSNDPRQELGQVLLAAGLIEQSALEEARQVQADTGVSLSRILTMVGKLEEGRLRALLEDRALDAVLDVFTWTDGTFAVERMHQAPIPSELAIAVQVPMCIEEGRKWLTRWDEIRQRIPADDMVLQLSDPGRAVVPEDSPARKEEIAALMQAVVEGVPVGQIVDRRPGPRFRSLDLLARLVERDALQVPAHPDTSGPSPESEIPVENLIAGARQMAESGDRDSALELARQALALDPADAKIQRLFRDIERAFFAELSRELLASFRVPRLLVAKKELDRLALSDSERYLAGRVDGRWDLLSLMRASPLREAEALIIFKRLADRGIISL